MKTFLFLIIIIGPFTTNGSDPDTTQSLYRGSRWYKMDFVAVQLAGNIGFISIGPGFSSSGARYHFSVLYGYVPRLVSDVSVHTISARNAFEILRIPVSDSNRIVLYGAMSLSLELGGRSFFFQPPDWPRRYYRFPKAIHLIPAVGAKLRAIKADSGCLKGYEVFAEVVTVDAYVWYKTLSNDVRLSDVLSCSVGINLQLR